MKEQPLPTLYQKRKRKSGNLLPICPANAEKHHQEKGNNEKLISEGSYENKELITTSATSNVLYST